MTMAGIPGERYEQMDRILFFIGAALPILWGIAHLFPTGNIVRDFGDISEDNRRIITMEWIVEGAALIFIGAVVGAATIVDHTAVLARVTYWLSFAMLNALSVISLLTGFKVDFIAFRLCPFIFTGSSIFILLGLLL